MNQNTLIRLEKEAEKMVLQIPASLDSEEFTSLFNEKFAELIIRECADALFEESIRLFELYSEENNLRLSEEYHMCSTQCLKDIAVIEKHFEVDILELKND
jgi:hypothetical protein